MERDDGGAAGEGPIAVLVPRAEFPSVLAVDVACGLAPSPATVQIRNAGTAELVIASARATGGYSVQTSLPLRVRVAEAGLLQLLPPAPKPSASIGDETTGLLSFETNEGSMTTHSVTLSSRLLGAKFEFTDRDGLKLGSTLTLGYKRTSVCPDRVKYRVQNVGNLAAVLTGPNMPANFVGSSANAQNIAPGDFVELSVSGVSAPGNACNASGQLVFTVSGSLCGSAPTLPVVWPRSGADWPSEFGSPCSCPLLER